MFRVGKLFVSIPGDPSIRERWKNIFRSILNLNRRNGDKYIWTKRERQIMKNYSFSIFLSSCNWTKESEGKENFSIDFEFSTKYGDPFDLVSFNVSNVWRKEEKQIMNDFLSSSNRIQKNRNKKRKFLRKKNFLIDFEFSTKCEWSMNLFDYEGRKADHRMIRSRFPLFVQRNGKEIRKRVKVKKIFQSILNFHRSMNNDFLSSSNEESNTK